MEKIKSHKDLAKHIEGKSILLLNSLGKDSVLCLFWLVHHAKPARITSLFFNFIASHPGDEKYLKYLKNTFPEVEFITEPNGVELTLVANGVYQEPAYVNFEVNSFEHIGFELMDLAKEIFVKGKYDYICRGESKYEDFSRRVLFHQKGILQKNMIFPLGMWSKEEIKGALEKCGIKLHPMYKYTESTYDHPSYWKMRYGMIANPEYERRLMTMYPLLALDKYRWEMMLNPKSGYIDFELLCTVLYATVFLLSLTYLLERF